MPSIPFATAPSHEVVAAIGRRLDALRRSRNLPQEQLAEQAGVSRGTLTRLANGDGISLDSLVRIMQAMGLGDHLATLLPDPSIRPVERARSGGRLRQRARRRPASPTAPWRWADPPAPREEPEA